MTAVSLVKMLYDGNLSNLPATLSGIDHCARKRDAHILLVGTREVVQNGFPEIHIEALEHVERLVFLDGHFVQKWALSVLTVKMV